VLQTLAEGSGKVLISDAPQSPVLGDFYRLQGQVLPSQQPLQIGKYEEYRDSPNLVPAEFFFPNVKGAAIWAKLNPGDWALRCIPDQDLATAFR
jgi:hypothetical protein